MPQWTHDCDSCQFLGSRDEYDIWFCAGSLLGGSVIARYGSDGPDYLSMPVNILKTHTASTGLQPLLHGFSLAQERGLIHG